MARPPRGGRRDGRRPSRDRTPGGVAPALPPRAAHKLLLVNANTPGEIRVVVLEDGQVAEIFVERRGQRQLTGNIYKGRVVNVEPSLQAAFVDLGSGSNGFLHASDCVPPDGGYAEVLHGTPLAAASVAGAGVAQASSLHERGRQDACATAPAAAAPAGVSAAPPTALPAAAPPPALALVGVPATPSAVGPVAPKKPRRRGRRGGRRHQRSGRARVGDPRAPLDAASLGEEPAAKAPPEAPAPPPPQPPTTAPQIEGAAPAPPAARRPRREGRPSRRGDLRRNFRRYTVQEMLHRGQDVLVQVSKEALGQKGPALTTYLSLAGRFLVLMPAIARLGVSKRIGDEDHRRELKGILSGLEVPPGLGVIVRTAGMGRKKEELKRDLAYLLNTWETLKGKARTARAPALLHEEGDVVMRVFRDVFSEDVTEIIVDDPGVLERARAYLQEISPGAERRLRLYSAAVPLFHHYGVEAQVRRLFHREVDLKGGGSLVIEQTEALTAIDVNTGSRREKQDQDQTILAVNLEAAREVARQLRLRDIGGLIMIDFIDMESLDHRRQVERELNAHLARDKARLNVMPISPLGIVEMTRQRVRHSLRKTFLQVCPCCRGLGQVKSAESLGLELHREILALLAAQHYPRLRVSLNPQTGLDIMNRFRERWAKLEEAHGVRIEAQGDPALPPGQWQLFAAHGAGDWTLKKSSEVDTYVRNN